MYPNPLHEDYDQHYCDHGLTVLDIVGKADLPALCVVDGRLIEADQWAAIVPERSLWVRRVPAGGNVAGAIGSIAVIALAWWAAPYAVGAMASAGFAFGTSFGAAVSMTAGVLSAVGMLALNALIPPPELPGGYGPAQKLNALTGVGNQVGQFVPIPVLYGTRQYYPPIPMTGLPYSELVGQDQYLRALFILGYGPLQIAGVSTASGLITSGMGTAIKIGGVDIDQFQDVEYQIGDPADVTLYTSSIVEQGVNVSMTQTGTASAQTWVPDGDTYLQSTDDDADEVSLDVYLPALYSVNGDNGKIRTAGVRFKVEARRVDTTPAGSWQTLLAVWEIVANSRDPIREGRRFNLPARGRYEIRVTRVSTYVNKTDGDSWVTDAVWTTLRTIKRNVRPFDVDNVVVMALRIRASDQLNGRLDQVSVEATRILPVWTGSAWSNQATRNPAWAYVDVLSGSATKNPIAKSRLDTTGINAWADWCATEGLYCDIVVDSAGTVFDRARDVASTGLATWNILADGSISVVRDVVSSSKMVIAPRNISEFNSDFQFVKTPHAFRVQFVDPNTWDATERIVYDDGYTSANATDYEELSLFGVTDPDQAWKIGRYHLAALQLRPEMYQWTQDIGHLIFQRGECVDIHHDAILVGLRAGRISTINAGKTSATVDEYLDMESGKTYALRIQRSDGSIITRTISTVTPGTQTVTFGSAATDVNAGDLFVFGISGAETIKAKITRIEPQAGFRARVTAVPAADDIFDAWSGTIPAFDPVLTTPVDQNRTPPPVPTIVDVAADLTTAIRGSAGELRARMAVVFSMPSDAVQDCAVEVRIRDVGVDESTSPYTTVYSPWRYVATVPARQGVVYIDGVEEEGSYQVAVRSLRGSLSSEWSDPYSHAIADFLQTTLEALLAAANDTAAIADGKIVTFYQATAPTGASEGDLWIDSDENNLLYRFSEATSPGQWVQVRDGGIAQAISDASNAQATADGKIFTFFQDEPPTADGVGDLWFDTNDSNRLYRWDGFSWVDVNVANGIRGDLSNQSHTVPADNDGSNPVLTGAVTTAYVFDGGDDVSALWSISKSESAGVSGSLTGKTYTVTGFTTDSGYVDFTLSRTGYGNIVLRFTLAKARAGGDGTPATVYMVEPSVNTVRRTGSTFTPASITFSAYSVTGTATRAAYAGRFKIYTTTNGTAWTARYTSSANESSKTYTIPAESTIVAIKAELYLAGGTTTLVDQETVPAILDGSDGTDGTDGTSPAVIQLSKNSAQVWAYADGSVASFAEATGQAYMFSGATDVGASTTWSAAASSGVTGTINTAAGTPVAGQPKGYYRITAMTGDTGYLTITGTYGGVGYTATFSLSKAKGGYEIVDALPTTNKFEGRIVFLTTDDKLYRYNGTAWTAAVPATDVTGTLTDAQLAAIAAAKITGTITGTQISDGAIATAKLAAGAVTAAKIAADTITADQIAANAVTATELAANAVTAVKIAASAVTADKISAGAVTAAKISVTDLSAINANMGTITAGTIRNSGSTFFIDASNSKIYSGKSTYGAADSGYFLGLDGVYPSIDIGNDTKYLRYKDGALSIGGDIVASGNIQASSITTTKVSNSAISDVQFYRKTTNTTVSGATVTVVETTEMTVPDIDGTGTTTVPVMVQYWIQTSVNSATSPIYYIYRNRTSADGSTSQYIMTLDPEGSSWSENFMSYAYVDDVLPGTYTWQHRIYIASPGRTVEDAFIMATALKK